MLDQRLWQGVLDAIRTERHAMYFYLRAAQRVRDPGAREVFERLAAEEREHLECFLEIYRGQEIPYFKELLDVFPEQVSEWWDELEGLLQDDFDDRMALQLALMKEKHLERQLRLTAADIEDPTIRSVYLVNADSTQQHFQALQEEYLRLFGGKPTG